MNLQRATRTELIGEVKRLRAQIRDLQSELNVNKAAGGCMWSPEEAHEPKESHPEWRAATDGRVG